MLTKFLIVLVFLMIIASLASALVYLLKNREPSPQTVKALTVRIGLSLFLFFCLLLGYKFGLVRPHGLNTQAKPSPHGSQENFAAPLAPPE